MERAGPHRDGRRMECRHEHRQERRREREVDPERVGRYRDFYHRPENGRLHEELNGEICSYLAPHVAQELRDACERGELRLKYPELTASYLLHAQVGLLGGSEVPMEERDALIRRYTELILDAGI